MVENQKVSYLGFGGSKERLNAGVTISALSLHGCGFLKQGPVCLRINKQFWPSCILTFSSSRGVQLVGNAIIRNYLRVLC